MNNKIDTSCITVGNNYRIEKLEGSNVPLIESISIRKSFREKWDEEIMHWVKAYKTIILDKNDCEIGKIYFEPNTWPDDKRASALFDLIKNEFIEVSSILIATNPGLFGYQEMEDRKNYFEPNLEDIVVAEKFKHYGEMANIPVKKQIKISHWGICPILPYE